MCTVKPPANSWPPYSIKYSFVSVISSTTETDPSERQEPRMQSLSSLPQTKTGFPYSSEIFPATRPKTPTRQAGFPTTITSLKSRFSNFFFTSRIIPATITFLSSLILERCSASTPARPSSSVERSSKALPGSSMREAAFKRGAIIKLTSSSVKYLWSMFNLAKSFCRPGRGDFRRTFSPK